MEEMMDPSLPVSVNMGKPTWKMEQRTVVLHSFPLSHSLSTSWMFFAYLITFILFI